MIKLSFGLGNTGNELTTQVVQILRTGQGDSRTISYRWDHTLLSVPRIWPRPTTTKSAFSRTASLHTASAVMPLSILWGASIPNLCFHLTR